MRILDVSKQPELVRNVKLFLNGKDVSNEAFWAVVPSKPGRLGLGMARLFKLNKEGKKYLRPDMKEAAKTVRVGLVRWEFKEVTAS